MEIGKKYRYNYSDVYWTCVTITDGYAILTLPTKTHDGKDNLSCHSIKISEWEKHMTKESTFKTERLPLWGRLEKRANMVFLSGGEYTDEQIWLDVTYDVESLKIADISVVYKDG